MKLDSDLFFAPCFGDAEDRDAGRENGWYLLYPAADPNESDVYVGPFVTLDAAYAASLEERV